MTSPQISLDLASKPSARVILERIRSDSRDESEKGRWFEQLFMSVALQEPEFETEAIWRWPDWPEREELTGLVGRDIGVDLVARRTTGEWVAIQCKCYDDRHTLGKGEIDKFLGGSQQSVFDLRWIVASCQWARIRSGQSRTPVPKSPKSTSVSSSTFRSRSTTRSARCRSRGRSKSRPSKMRSWG